jgi:hypothetical protein
MADVILKDDPLPRSPRDHANGPLTEPLSAAETPEIPIIELLFFAYRDFISDPDAALITLGFGRAHHRVIHFVNRHPGIRVADLLDILKITKQSLGRVLKQLALALGLLEPQAHRIGNALASLSPAEASGVVKFLRLVVDAGERDKVARLIGG